MPIVLVLLLMWAASLSSCVQNANAFTIADKPVDAKRIELMCFRFELMCFVAELMCFTPAYLSIDRLDVHGVQYANIRLTARWRF